MKCYKSNDNHFYKVDGLEGVLHVNKSALLLNVIHNDVFEDIRDEAAKSHAPLTEIDIADFVVAYHRVLNSIFKVGTR